MKWLMALLVVVVGALTSGPATAGTTTGPQLVTSAPAHDTTVPRGPDLVRLVFDREVSAADVRMTAAADGVEVAVTPPVLDGKAVTVQVPPGLASGRYRVSYAVQDNNGGQAKGSMMFTSTSGEQQTPPEVTLPTVSQTPTTAAPTQTPTATEPTTTAPPTTVPTPSAPTSPAPGSAPSAGNSGGGSVVWVVAGVLAVGLAVLVGLNVHSRRRVQGEREHVEPDPDHL